MLCRIHRPLGSSGAFPEQAGLLRLEQRPHHVGELIGSSTNPQGVGSQTLVYNAKRNPIDPGLVLEENEKTGPFRLNPRITEKDRRFAEKTGEILEIVEGVGIDEEGRGRAISTGRESD